jgi:hypothetical protein
MTVNLSYFAGAGWQFFNNDGVPLAGGLIYTYTAGTTTPQTTYTTSAGNVAHSNPIVLNSAGRIDNEIWLTAGVTYKFVLKTSSGSLIGTYDNLVSVNDISILAQPTGSSLVGFIQSGSGAVAMTVQAKLREWIDIEDFGAVGDDSTDNTTAITNAIAAVPTGGVLYIPDGIFRTGPLTITKSLRLQGANKEGAILKLVTTTAGAALIHADVATIFLRDLTLTSATYNDGLGLVGLKHVQTANASVGYCDSRTIAITNFSGTGIELRSAIFYKIDGVFIYRCGIGVFIGQSTFGNDSTTVIIDNAYVTNCTKGINIQSGADFDLRNCIFEYCGSNTTTDAALMLINVNQVMLTNMYYEQNYRDRNISDGRYQEYSRHYGPGSPAADVITYSGTAFASRGFLLANNNNIQFGKRDGVGSADVICAYQGSGTFLGLGVDQGLGDGTEVIITELTGNFPGRLVVNYGVPTLSGPDIVYYKSLWGANTGGYAVAGGTEVEALGMYGGYGDVGTTHGFSIGSTRTTTTLSGATLDISALVRDSASVKLAHFDDVGNFYPETDGGPNLGSGTNRWDTVYATTGTINTSDAREKTDIAASDLGLSFINSLKPVKYKWKIGSTKFIDKQIGEAPQVIEPAEHDEDGNIVKPEIVEVRPVYEREKVQTPGKRNHYGLLAQDVKELTDKFGVDFAGWILTDPSNSESGQGLRYYEFIAPLIAAVQELSAKVEALEKQIEATK